MQLCMQIEIEKIGYPRRLIDEENELEMIQR